MVTRECGGYGGRSGRRKDGKKDKWVVYLRKNVDMNDE